MKFIIFAILLTVTEVELLLGQQSVSFAFLTDLHVSPGYASDSSLQKIVGEINKTDFDFTIITGDLTNTGSDAELLAVRN